MRWLQQGIWSEKTDQPRSPRSPTGKEREEEEETSRDTEEEGALREMGGTQEKTGA